VTRYRLIFLQSAGQEFLALPRRHQRLFREILPYLLANPFRSYPWVRVREGPRHRGEWRFHLVEFRGFYHIDGLNVVITRIARRLRAYPRRGIPARRSS
jgi:mRNA-degrading endonuclease RelE of RelBE toxin-antitoxin system